MLFHTGQHTTTRQSAAHISNTFVCLSVSVCVTTTIIEIIITSEQLAGGPMRRACVCSVWALNSKWISVCVCVASRLCADLQEVCPRPLFHSLDRSVRDPRLKKAHRCCLRNVVVAAAVVIYTRWPLETQTSRVEATSLQSSGAVHCRDLSDDSVLFGPRAGIGLWRVGLDWIGSDWIGAI